MRYVIVGTSEISTKKNELFTFNEFSKHMTGLLMSCDMV